MKLLIIRPEPGASTTAARAEAAGLKPILLPLFAIAPRRWLASPPVNFDALLFTSANAVRHAGAGLNGYRALPVHAVGERTATALRKIGVEPASTGSAGVDEALLAASVVGHKRLLWLAGETHITPAIPQGVSVETIICYASETLPLPPNAMQLLAQADAVALHSPRAAQHFAEMLDSLGVEKSSLTIAAFSPAIATAAGQGWRAVAVAAKPTDRDLLSALHELATRQSIAEIGKDST